VNESGQTSDDHASSWTDPDDAERLTGIYGSDGQAGTTASRQALYKRRVRGSRLEA